MISFSVRRPKSGDARIDIRRLSTPYLNQLLYLLLVGKNHSFLAPRKVKNEEIQALIDLILDENDNDDSQIPREKSTT